ncbi:Protein FAR1-RELATED SEQUENCE 8 [Bienertia sinuspersici]
MNESSPDSEDLVEEMEDQEDDDELLEFEGNDYESEDHHGFGIDGHNHENDSEQFFEIDGNIHEESEQLVELEGEDHCSNSQQFLEVRDRNAKNDTLQVLNLNGNDQENNQGINMMIMDDEDGLSKEKYYHPPVVGMEFESYDDAYNYYNCYAKELGFAIRVKSSWTKRNSKEKRGAVLCCNCEGFKTFKEATCRRKDTRTGCLAMIRLRLVETNRWRVDEVKLEHNHLFDPERVQNSKSHKKMEVRAKRNLEPTVDVEVRTIKLYRTSSMLNRTVYNCLKSDEFEASWDNMMEQFGIRDLEWLQFLYEDREKWAPVYQKDTLLARLFTAQTAESIPFFAGHIHERTSMKEFFDLYDVIVQKKLLKEALDDLESSESNLLLRTRCYYELQLSKFYTTEIFEKFQVEVEMMSCCMTILQVHTFGPVITYLVKEYDSGGVKEFKSFEVMYDKTANEVRCICGGFYLNGYLCRHALSILNHNGVEEIPFSYILQRWRKDCKRLYVPDIGSNVVDVSNPTQWYDHLHKRAMHVVEAGMVSQEHYMVAWQAFRESLNKLPFLHKMDEDSGNIGRELDLDGSIILESESDRAELDTENILSDGKYEFVAPAIGMEFESYDDAYNYYNCYAKEVGFRVRVKNSWFKRNSKEKYGAVLCCSSQGFKRIKDVNRLRKETRTGCPAMIRMRLVDSKRWRILEVTLEHNHLLGPKMYKTIKTVDADSKRKPLSNSNAEGQTIKLFKAVVIDSVDTGYLNTSAKETQSFSNHPNQLHLKKEIFQKFQLEVEEMYSCFSTTQLHIDGPYVIFLVKERLRGEGNRREIRDYEVYYNRGSAEVRCICSCFNFNGYLCRHALCVLNFNGVEEIPAKYILSRWKKDYKRSYVLDHSNIVVDSNDQFQWFNQLYRSALRVVEEGVISLDHYKSGLEAFEESLNRVHNVEEKHE